MKAEEIEKLFRAGPLCCGKHEAAIQRLLAERDALLVALRAVEWNGEAGHWEAGGCPECRGEELRNWQRGDHHEAGCKLRAALTLAES